MTLSKAVPSCLKMEFLRRNVTELLGNNTPSILGEQMFQSLRRNLQAHPDIQHKDRP